MHSVCIAVQEFDDGEDAFVRVREAGSAVTVTLARTDGADTPESRPLLSVIVMVRTP